MTDLPEAIVSCLAGRIAPGVALARLILAGMTPHEIGAVLPAGSDMAALHARHADGLASLASMLRCSEVDHGVGSLDGIRRSFERAVLAAPEASVAAYCLGDPGLLADATGELADWLGGERLIGLDTDLLDVGCGIGRVAAAVGPTVRSVLGIDIAWGMIDEARRRAVAPNLRFELTDGVSVPVEDRSFDLVLFVDSMPYLVQAGVADQQMLECLRTLRSGGALVMLNLSYDGLAERHADDWARRLDLSLRRCGQPFRSWDASAYVFMTPR